MSFWCLQFPPKNEQKQVNLRFHNSKLEFVHLFFGGNVGLKKSFRLCLTFSDRENYRSGICKNFEITITIFQTIRGQDFF